MGKVKYGKGGSKYVSSNKGSYAETWHYKGGKATEITHTENRSGKSHSHNVGRGILGPFVGSRKNNNIRRRGAKNAPLGTQKEGKKDE